MQLENNVIHTVALNWADSQDGALASDIISLKNYRQADIYIMVGATVGQAAAVTLHKGASVSTAATALAFTRYLETGFILDYDGASDTVLEAAGAAFTAAGGGAGVVYSDNGNRLVCYGYNGTTFVDNETITFTTSGRTAVANGIQKNTDIMVPRTASSNTFNVNAAGSKFYCIPITADMLGDGYDCIELNVADMNTTDLAAWVNLSGFRFMQEIAETAIYD